MRSLAALTLLALPAVAQDPLYQLDGTAPSSYAGLGYALASGHDATGDGVADLFVGSPFEPGNGGSVRLFDGVDGTLVLGPITQSDLSAQFGRAVALIGDVDGDQLADLVIGGSQLRSPVPTLPGFVELRSSADGSLLWHVSGDGAGDEFGAAVASTSDLDGDSIPDVLVGAYLSDVNGLSSGRVKLLSGADGAVIHDMWGAPGSLFGDSVAAGDLDGDGSDELIVGAAGQSAAVGYVQARDGLTPNVLWTRAGVAQYDRLGRSIAVIGDVDGDGKPDVAAGAPGSGGDFVYLLKGTSGAILRRFDAPVAGDYFGGAVEGVGDVDLDGVADLAIGAKWADSGGTSFTGAVWVVSGADGTYLRELSGELGGDRYGYAFAALGDVDQDGFGDFAVGAPQSYNPGAGYVEVHRARPYLVADTRTLSLATGGQQSLSLDAAADGASHVYLVLGSASGTSPGITLLGLSLPLNPDAWFAYTLANPNVGPLVSTFGALDGDGRASAAIALAPASDPALAGLALDHAFGTVDALTLAAGVASNAVSLTLVP